MEIISELSWKTTSISTLLRLFSCNLAHGTNTFSNQFDQTDFRLTSYYKRLDKYETCVPTRKRIDPDRQRDLDILCPDFYDDEFQEDVSQFTKWPWRPDPDEEDDAFSLYEDGINRKIDTMRDNASEYYKLPIAATMKYLINIWMQVPSMRLNLVPLDILKIYLKDVKTYGVEFIPLFKLTHLISLETLSWNYGNTIRDTSEKLIAVGVTTGELMLGIYNRASKKFPRVRADGYYNRHYFIDHKKRFQGGLDFYSVVETLGSEPNGYFTGDSVSLLKVFFDLALSF